MGSDKHLTKKSAGNDRKSRGSTKPGVIMPVPAALPDMPQGYAVFFSDLKDRITRERIKAVLSANSAMVILYWDIGRAILERQGRRIYPPLMPLDFPGRGDWFSAYLPTVLRWARALSGGACRLPADKL